MSQNNIVLAKDTIDKEDFDCLIDWLKTYPRLTKGEQTIEFENKAAKYIGCNHAVFVNSGSSANLLMIYALIASRRLKNKKIVVPALSWITDISPVIQFGLQPILVDCNMMDLSVDLEHLEIIFRKENPSCLLLVSVLGLVPNMDDIIGLCRQYNVILLEDNCESMGSEYKHQKLGTFGLMASYSTYFGHIISTIEGGIITTDDDDLYNILKMLRSHGWDRDIDEGSKQSLRDKYDVSGFNSLYTFYLTGFNLRSTDLQAFIGIKQLDKLDKIVNQRNKNFLRLNSLIENEFWKPAMYPDDCIANLGYPVIHPNRDMIAEKCIKNNIEVRPLISGSMGVQPFYKDLFGELRLPNVSIIDKSGMYIPNHPFLKEEDIIFMSNLINECIIYAK